MSTAPADMVTASMPKRSRLAKASFILGGIPAIWLVFFFFVSAQYPSSSFVVNWINDFDLMRPIFIFFGVLGCAGVAFGMAAIIAIAVSRGKVCGWDIALLGILMGSIGAYFMMASLNPSHIVR